MITGIDLVSIEVLEKIIVDYKNLLKKLKFKKVNLEVRSTKDILLFSRNLDEAIHPIFLISSKTGAGLDYLTHFFSLIPTNHNFEKKILSKDNNIIGIHKDCNNIGFHFDIHEHFSNKEKKIVVAGFLAKGKISVGQNCYLGPDKLGNYSVVQIEELHCKKVPSKVAFQGQFATLCIKSNILLNIYFFRRWIIT